MSKLTEKINVRLDLREKKGLERIAKHLHLKPSQLIRQVLSDYVKKWERIIDADNDD